MTELGLDLSDNSLWNLDKAGWDLATKQVG
jgi:hypothetical protein